MTTSDHTPDTLEIQLTRGFVTVVDAVDADLAAVTWTATTNGYATRHIQENKKPRSYLLHRVILSRMLDRELTRQEVTDHINGNKLDNRRSNLRLATLQQNAANSKQRSDATARYKGVTWNKARQLWAAQIQTNNQSRSIGFFNTEEEAAIAYNHAAMDVFGEFARVNDIPNWRDCSPIPIKKGQRRQQNNRSGYPHVVFNKQRQRWTAQYNRDGKRIYLGGYPSAEEAYAAYCAAVGIAPDIA